MSRARAAALLAGSLLPLAGCADTVGGTPSAGAGPTTSCSWRADARNPSAVEVDPPPDEVPAAGTATLRMTTGRGDLALELDQERSPCAAASLVHLARLGFFDGTTCHRETDVPGLQVLQCGDPTGTGTGGPSYTFPTDVDGSETYPRGTLAMANSGQGFDGSQFFLVWGDSELPPDYTVFGRVDEAGRQVLDEIAAQGNDGSNRPGDGAPTEPVTIETMTVA